MEKQLVDWIARTAKPHVSLRVGIGDDAAVLRWGEGSDLVVATDAITDQVDFKLDDVAPFQIGRKALAVNLSDLAAMAAEPVAAFVSLVLPRRGGAGRNCEQLAKEILAGMMPLAEQLGVAIAGGDTNTWDGPLAVNVAVVGRTTKYGPLTRSGGQVGDQLLVTGPLGGSILRRQFDFEPRIALALELNAKYQLHAGIDISDGLAIDASRLAAASGVGAIIEPSAVPITDDARALAESSGESPLQHALGDGEDFELLLAVPPESAQRLVDAKPLGDQIVRIGELIETRGLWQLDERDSRVPLKATGYEHVGDAT